MVVGDVFHQALEQQRVVAGLHRVGNVVQVDLELRRGAFLDHGIGRDALLFGAFENVLQAFGVFIQVVDHVDLGGLRALAGQRRQWRLRTAVHVGLVDQVELQLERGADGQAQRIELFHHLLQDSAWIGKEGFTFHFVHGHQQLSGRTLLPRLVAQGVGDRVADAVGVADVQAQAGAFYGGAINVESK